MNNTFSITVLYEGATNAYSKCCSSHRSRKTLPLRPQFSLAFFSSRISE